MALDPLSATLKGQVWEYWKKVDDWFLNKIPKQGRKIKGVLVNEADSRTLAAKSSLK